MLIEIKTKACMFENGFALYRTEFLDSVKMETEKDFYLCQSQFEADLLVIGLSLKYIMEFDNKFGIEIVSGFKEKHSDKDFKQLAFREIYRKYKESDERCDVIIYTDNIEVFENFYYSNRAYNNPIIKKMLLRITALQKESAIKISLTKDVMEVWQKDAIRKYA